MYWKQKTIRRNFSKRLDSFTDMCWNAKLSFPPIHMHVRKSLQSLQNLNVFPIKNDGNVEFENECNRLYDARECFAERTAEVSKDILNTLLQFAKDVNLKYKDLVTEETTNYLKQSGLLSEKQNSVFFWPIINAFFAISI